MWFKVNISREILVKDKPKTVLETYLCDTDNFAEAGYKVMQYWRGECEVEDVMLMKTLKPLGNEKYAESNKVYIVKIAEDFVQDDGSIRTMKYSVPFYADSQSELQEYVRFYMSQGLQDMRITTISETKWEII